MSRSNRLWSVFVLALIGLSVSIYQTIHFFELKFGEAGFKSVCSVGGFDCTAVETSSYAEFIFGLPLSGFAAAWFLSALILVLVARSTEGESRALKTLFGLSTFSIAVSATYLFIMMSIIQQFCLFCLILDATLLLIFLILFTLKPGKPWEALVKENWKLLFWTTGLPLIVSIFVMVLANLSHPLNGEGAQEIMLRTFGRDPNLFTQKMLLCL